MKFVILEATLVGKLFRLKPAVLSFYLTLFKISLIKGSIGKNVNAFAIEQTLLKIAEQHAPIFFVNLSKALRF